MWMHLDINQEEYAAVMAELDRWVRAFVAWVRQLA